ncbi:hypothetical protein [Polynucleobacter antarcticus]|uniref:Uncharacterized protein n=1 Tax=Polynucleobacter antarcticus TaxID=1743162 RepID=A0A6M9Q1Y6_9BURK|nr:hypothetical protein [Polynucleobacter antarcticus]QKM62283.1 hypothetical protein DCO16_03870 [Polynucleobacter antarcticus]
MQNKLNNIKIPRPIINHDGEVRHLSAQDLKLFKPAKDILPLELFKSLVDMNKTASGRSRLKK